MTFKRYFIKGPSLKHATSHGALPPSAVMVDSHMVQSEKGEENCYRKQLTFFCCIGT